MAIVTSFLFIENSCLIVKSFSFGILFFTAESLTASQIEILKTGNLTISTTVGRLIGFEGSETLTINIRKCGMETQIYIKPPMIHFSGFCLSKC